MLDYNIQINNGSEALGTTAKTITVNEAPKQISLDFIVEELEHKNPLVPQRAIKDVLTSFSEVAARLMAEGFYVPLYNDKGEQMARFYADMHLATKNGNINLSLAQSMMPDEVTDEASMVAHAQDLVDRCTIQIRAKAEIEQKMTELMKSFNPKIQRKGVVEKAYVPKKDSSATPDDNQGGTNGGGGGNNEEG